jgi:rare lipoprotein A (peptidoglycan hydrolase)
VDAYDGPMVTVTVVHDGRSDTKASTATTVAGVLHLMGLSLNSLDKVVPGLTTAPVDGSTVRLIRVTQSTERQDLTVPFKQVNRSTDSLELGDSKVSQEGADGLSQRVFQKTYEDGNLVSTVSLGIQVVRAPRDQVTLVGTHRPHFVSHDASSQGLATWYGIDGLTAASRDLPFGTVVHVTNLITGRTVDVVIRDRGPFADPSRIIDLSPTAFSQIAPLGSGIVPVKIEW